MSELSICTTRNSDYIHAHLLCTIVEVSSLQGSVPTFSHTLRLARTPFFPFTGWRLHKGAAACEARGTEGAVQLGGYSTEESESLDRPYLRPRGHGTDVQFLKCSPRNFRASPRLVPSIASGCCRHSWPVRGSANGFKSDLIASRTPGTSGRLRCRLPGDH